MKMTNNTVYSNSSEQRTHWGWGVVPCREVVLFSEDFYWKVIKDKKTTPVTLNGFKMYYYNILCAYIFILILFTITR